jgi:hypothetical protein
MRMKWAPLSYAVMALLCQVGTANAQTAPQVTQSPTRADASTFLYGEGGAGGPGIVTGCNSASATVAQTTVTIPAQPGSYIYITGYYGHLAEINATGTGVAAVTVSVTNIAGGAFWDYGTVTNTTGADQQYFNETFPTALKAAQPGVAVTFVPSGAMDANHLLCQRVSGFYATQ